MTTFKLIGALWFTSAIFIDVIQNLVFVLWLRQKGLRIVFGFAGIPGYVDYVYFKWCKTQGRSPTRILVLRGLCLANALVAAAVVIPTVICAGSK